MTTDNRIKAPLNKGDYHKFWYANCAFCSKSPHRKGNCEIQNQLCLANMSLYGLSDECPPPTPEISLILGSGCVDQDIADRLGLDESSDRIPESCPEINIVCQGEHEREPGITAEKIEQMADEYKRTRGDLV